MLNSTTHVYLYHQRHRVIFLDTGGDYFSRRYRQVYTNNLIAHKATDNQILFEFVNQDQKRVDVTGKTFTFRLISKNGDILVLEKDLVAVNESEGQIKVILTEEDLTGLVPGLFNYSIEQLSINGLYEPVFVDDNAGARGVIEVKDSIMPTFIESKTLTIPNFGTNTSIINTEAVSSHTFQIVMDNYSGVITVEGATDTDNLWYEIEVFTITSSNLLLFNIIGNHPYLRFNIIDDGSNTGEVVKITYR